MVMRDDHDDYDIKCDASTFFMSSLIYEVANQMVKKTSFYVCLLMVGLFQN